MRARTRLIRLILAVSGGLFLLNALLSLRWPFRHDPPILLYMTWLMDRFGLVPYRDIFDMNLPGTYAVYALIGRTSGYTDLGVRCVDLGILAGELVLTWLWMKRLGVSIALCGAVLWGLCYLQLGSQVSIQREYLLLLPVLAALVLADRCGESFPSWSAFGVGLFFGLAALMKPHAAIGLPLVLLLGEKPRDAGAMPVRTVLALAGFLVPVAVSLVYLWDNGGLAAFMDMARNYWPLYAQLSGEHQTLSGLGRMRYLWTEFRQLGGFGLWLVPAAFGAYFSLYRAGLADERKRRVVLLIALAFCYGLYPLFSGQFWIYHWLVFLYFTLQLASLCLVDPPPEWSGADRLVPVIVLASVILLHVQGPEGIDSALEGKGVPPVHGGRVEAIASFLSARMRPGDTVQPLDWTGGAVHAMLLSRARLATPFVYDFHFYHHVSSAYIQELRRRFIAALSGARPRFIIQVVAPDKPWVGGEDTTMEFPELASLIASNYAVVSSGQGYIIYGLRPSFVP